MGVGMTQMVWGWFVGLIEPQLTDVFVGYTLPLCLVQTHFRGVGRMRWLWPVNSHARNVKHIVCGAGEGCCRHRGHWASGVWVGGLVVSWNLAFVVGT